MTGRLADKVCIISGTGGSIARAAALLFTAEGAAIVGCDINVDRAQETVDVVPKKKVGRVMRPQFASAKFKN